MTSPATDLPVIAFVDAPDDLAPDLAPDGVADRLAADDADPAVVILTCANCGALMDERKCKLICRCGYFLSCSDYY